MNESDVDTRIAPAQSAPTQADPPEGDKLTTAEMAGLGDKSSNPAEPVGTAAASPAVTSSETATPLLGHGESGDFKTRWDTIQASFVDEPRHAVEEADHLVATAMKRLAEVFASERANLESQWGRGDDVSTEDLRVALRRYRSFFGRLLAV